MYFYSLNMISCNIIILESFFFPPLYIEGCYISTISSLANRWDYMMLNATVNNISVISCRSVLLLEKTTDLPKVTDKLHSIMLDRVHLAITLVVMCTVCIDSCQSNYHTITTVTVHYMG